MRVHSAEATPGGDLESVGHTREDGSSGEAPQTRQVFREVVSSKRATNAS